MKQHCILLMMIIFVAGCTHTKTSQSSGSDSVRKSMVHKEDPKLANWIYNRSKYDSSDYRIYVLDTSAIEPVQVHLKMYVVQASREKLFTACNRHATADYRHWAIVPDPLINILTKGDSLIEGRYYINQRLDYFLLYRLVDTVGGTNLYLTVRNNDKNFAWDYGVTWVKKAISIAKEVFLIYKQFGRIDFGDE